MRCQNLKTSQWYCMASSLLFHRAIFSSLYTVLSAPQREGYHCCFGCRRMYNVKMHVKISDQLRAQGKRKRHFQRGERGFWSDGFFCKAWECVLQGSIWIILRMVDSFFILSYIFLWIGVKGTVQSKRLSDVLNKCLKCYISLTKLFRRPLWLQKA